MRRRAARHAALGEPLRLAVVEALWLGDLAPDELADSLGVGTNLLSHHLDVLVAAGLVRRGRSHGDRRRRYVRLVADDLDHLIHPPTLRADRVLFVCTANSARSQIARALWARHSAVPASSAGPAPAPRVHHRAITTAAAHGLDVGDATPRGYDAVTPDPGLVVSVCDLAREAHVPFDAPRLHWSVADPAQEDDDPAFEAAYRDLEARVTRLAPLVQPGRPPGRLSRTGR